MRCTVSTAAAPSRQQRMQGLQQGGRLLRLRPKAVLTAQAAELDVAKMSPLGDRLLVKPREAEQVSAGGILLAGSPKQAMADALVGEVLAVGEDVELPGVSKGDTVLFSKYSSSDVAVPDGEVCFVAQRSVLAKLSS